jgi:antitoxin (DNA-binding transcriptional repressor) of toxin-antitoxin stability system
MRTVSIRELKNNPSEALRDAREAPVLVLNHGRPEALLVAVGDPADAQGLEARLSEAAALVRDLAGDGGARAVRAVDLAVRPGSSGVRGRRAGEAAAPYGPPKSPLTAADLARLVGAICTLCRPRRILLGSARELVVVCTAVPEPATRAALEQMAIRAHATIVVQKPEDAPATDGPWELVFEAADAAVTTLDRLIAEGRAHPPRRAGPFLIPSISLPPGIDLPAILDEMREDRS